MTSLNPHRIEFRPIWPLLAVAAVVVLLAFGGETARLALRYDKSAIDAGQWWRLVTGHFVHLGWSHTVLNLAGLGLAGMLFPREYRPAQWVIIGMASLGAISLGFVSLRPDLAWYVGLSGVLHGLFVAGALRWMWRREYEGYLLAGFMLAKLYWEQRYGALPFSVTSAGGPVVVDAHLAGTIGGGAAAVAVLLRDATPWRR